MVNGQEGIGKKQRNTQEKVDNRRKILVQLWKVEAKERHVKYYDMITAEHVYEKTPSGDSGVSDLVTAASVR